MDFVWECPGYSRVRLGKGLTEMCEGNEKKSHAATSPENWHGAAEWQSKNGRTGLRSNISSFSGVKTAQIA